MDRSVAVIGVPMDLGAGRRGVDMGPSAIRRAGLKHRLEQLGCRVRDLGDLRVPPPEEAEVGDPRCKYLAAIAKTCHRLGATVQGVVEGGALPLVLGGDHAIAIGTIAGLARAHRDTAVLWFDAHGDFNTAETTSSGNVHGMPLAVSVGRGGPRSAQRVEARRRSARSGWWRSASASSTIWSARPCGTPRSPCSR